MLFNSQEFLFVFLPITVIIFYLISQKFTGTLPYIWLVCASLFFYSWWNPKYLFLLIISMVVNYFIGRSLSDLRSKALLVVGLAFNLGLIGYFKYANFFVESFNSATTAGITLEVIILPLAISFFTFQQIAYLVDAYQGKSHEYRFIHYCLFVTFFPQLIAGPIVHHSEMMSQFDRPSARRPMARDIAIGLSILAIGLWKKVVLADSVAVHANAAFDAADSGVALTLFEAWGGVLAYSLEIYFDFSGYSDMAIGLARLFGIRLPINFNSPYKAANIIEFWRRWHITLSRFLRDYLYFPLGGNRKGPLRRHVNLLLVMLLGGLWHGAGWTFVIWGGLHGVYLIVNHGWNAICRGFGLRGHRITRIAAQFLTFTCVVVAWVPFRATTIGGVKVILEGMAGLNGIRLPSPAAEYLPGLASVLPVEFGEVPYFDFPEQGVMIAALLGIAWFLPNTQEWMARYQPALESSGIQTGPLGRMLQWRPTALAAIALGALAAVSVIFTIVGRPSEFLYFQF